MDDVDGSLQMAPNLEILLYSGDTVKAEEDLAWERYLSCDLDNLDNLDWLQGNVGKGPAKSELYSTKYMEMFPQIQFTKSTTRRTGQRPSRKAVIEDLRRQVINLTKTLQNLRQRTKNATRHNFHQCPSATNLQDKVWEQIAARQLRQRQKSESENTRLRRILQYQKRVRKNFKRLFRRRCDDKMLEEMPYLPRSIHFVSNNSVDIEGEFDKLRADIDTVYTTKLYQEFDLRHSSSSGRQRKLNYNAVNDTYIEFYDTNNVPFSFSSTARAVWEALKVPKYRDGEHVNTKLCAEETHHTNSMIKTIIGYTCTAANASVYVKEMRVARKYVEQTQVLFVCRAVSLIVGKSGNPYGLRIEETMVISVRKADGLTTANETAVVNTYLCAARYDNGEKKTIPFRNKSFVDIAVKGWDCKLTLLNQRIENILFDEAVSAARNQKYPT